MNSAGITRFYALLTIATTITKCCRGLWSFHAAGTREHATLALQYGSYQLIEGAVWPILRAAILNDKVAAVIDVTNTSYMNDFYDNDIVGIDGFGSTANMLLEEYVISFRSRWNTIKVFIVLSSTMCKMNAGIC